MVKELVAGERVERPYPDSKSRVLPLDDPAAHFQPNHDFGAQDQIAVERIGHSSGLQVEQ
jgi:hypothetical protein